MTEILPSSERRWATPLSWGLGVLWMGSALVHLFGPNGGPHLIVSALAGAIILPPIASVLRARFPVFRPFWAPPAIAFALLLVVGGAVKLATNTLTPPPKPVVAAEAPKTPTKKLAVDPEAQRLIDEWTAMDDGARFAFQIDDHLMASVEAISAAPPDNMPDIWARLSEIERMAAKVREGHGTKLNDAQRKKLSKFEAALSAKQERVFPQLRKAYRSLSKSTLWERDIDVRGSGRTIEYIGGLFASNANIKAAQDVVGADLVRLRFDIARYRWIPDGRGAQYSLDAPPDRKVVG